MVDVKYRVEVERDESGAWIGRVSDIPGCHTYGRSLRQLRTRVPEALSLWVDNADKADLEFDIRLPAGMRSRVRSARAAQEKAARVQEEAQRSLVLAAKELTETFGLSVRDAADLIGLSHQRVQQLRTESTRAGRRRRSVEHGNAQPKRAVG